MPITGFDSFGDMGGASTSGAGGAGGASGAGGVINLSKHEKINLSKKAPGLKKILIGLGWNINTFASKGADFDLDASVFMVDNNGRTSESGFIFYNNLVGAGVTHMGDNRVGSADNNDAEQIEIDLDAIPANIDKIAITVTIDDADNRRQNFSMVESSFIRLVDKATDKEIVRTDLREEFGTETAIVFAEIYRYQGEWQYRIIGDGFSGGLMALCSRYGLAAEYK